MTLLGTRHKLISTYLRTIAENTDQLAENTGPDPCSTGLIHMFSAFLL